MFQQASELSPNEIKSYRNFAFTGEVSNPAHDPFFSVENAALWITSLGYQLYALHDDSVVSVTRWSPEDASTRQLIAYRTYIIADQYLEHHFFSLENPSTWINPVAFQAYMDSTQTPDDRSRARYSTSTSSRAASSVSRAESPRSSPMSFVPSSRGSSPVSSELPSRPPSSMSVEVIEIHDSDSEDSGSMVAVGKPSGAASDVPVLLVPKVEDVTIISTPPAAISDPKPTRNKNKAKQKQPKQISITCQEKVDQIIHSTTLPTTYDVPRIPTAILEIFSGVERYEADEDDMRELWNRELDQNEVEAASASAIICRFYARVKRSTCKIKCEGVPILVPLRTPSTYGKDFFVGCSHWKAAEKDKHIYWPISANINQGLVRYVFENNGRLPNGPASLNEECVLTVHPRIGLKYCSYSHIIGGQIRVAKMTRRPCQSKLIVFTPVKPTPATLHKAIVILRDPHNHPMHPKTKPSAEDNTQLGMAVKSAGLLGLTVQKLRDAPSTSALYGGKQVAETSPAFADNRRVRDFITMQKRVEYPMGMGWEGVLHELNVRQVTLPKSERYIHTAMSKNDFRLVVTMHPQIANFFHKLLSLSIDYTFKRVEGSMDEWEVAGFLDRFKQRLTFASLYCDKKTKEAFAQLFTELFDTIYEVTGERLKLAPFFPDAKCRVVIMDGEVPQAQGYAQFLATYLNDPKISGISTRDTVELLSSNLKTCNPHFERHIDELPKHISVQHIARLKSIMGLETTNEIEVWHKFCAAHEDDAVKNWYAHKLANPWILPSINKFLSGISDEDWDLTPNHSNYVETAHAGRNAETGIRARLLEAILSARDRDNIKAEELALIERSGVMRKRWNGNADREKVAAQRSIWKSKKSAARNDQLTSYETLKTERDAGAEENKASLERQKILDGQIKSLQEAMKLDKHRTDLKEKVNSLQVDVEEEKSLRREWTIRRAEIIKELETLRKGDLAGVRIKGRRADERTEGDGSLTGCSSPSSHMDNSISAPILNNLDINFNAGSQGQDESTTADQIISASSSLQYNSGSHGDDLFSFLAQNLNVYKVIYIQRVANSIRGFNAKSVQHSDHLATNTDWTTGMDWTDMSVMDGLFSNSWNPDAFLATVDPSMFDFMNYGPGPGENSGSVLENQTTGPGEDDDDADGDYDDGLEYIGPPFAGPAPLYANDDAMDVSELPPLPPPPTFYASHDSPDEHTTNVFAKKYIVAGKRKRTQSTRAADATAAGPTKKSSHQSARKI
ncbi:hypothetical protein B0H19DRAFT_1272287 [Mycena capillaripes]|nr:hypothetical protein B0H19DRAFT_1272287 [Mycena capillaripes]